ncbi:response regulator transcription factor [Bacillus sp. RG28]|uniref:Response regulator transcription factor n=1 Tax=Gottfriedia endophytica TaxID=2820819 RepID=A0A940NKK0_9BACI|nr:response regulator transcription factor [Gottfriedia endophytica]MBP0725907.1 response regulator transcription factor [Gottfriedia endophytica]
MFKTVLIIEDELRLRDIVKEYFVQENFHVIEAADGVEGLDLFEQNDVHLVILDIMIPKIDGWNVCKKIRETSNTPIIMVTARSDEEDQLIGFDIGADEYVTKPFSPKILVAKAKSLLKRVGELTSTELNERTKSGITLNPKSRTVFIEEEQVFLTNKEFELLHYLIENKDIVLTREQLLNQIWGYDYDGDDRTVDTHIKKLRQKIGGKASNIVTVIRVGYKFEEN